MDGVSLVETPIFFERSEIVPICLAGNCSLRSLEK